MPTITKNSDKFQISVDPGEEITLNTADTYVDKNISIIANAPESGEAASVGNPIATKGPVSNHSVTITPSVTVNGKAKTGNAVSVTASELVSGTLEVNKNETNDVTNYKDVRTSVAPLIVILQTTVPTSGQNTISFSGLPSMPRAWTLDCAQSTQNVTWNNIYRCISARYDGSTTYTYTAYKGNQGSANPYIYMVDNGNGFTQTYNNGTLTFTTNSTGSQTYCGPFLARTYVLMAVCDNDGTSDIYRGG